MRERAGTSFARAHIHIYYYYYYYARSSAHPCCFASRSCERTPRTLAHAHSQAEGGGGGGGGGLAAAYRAAAADPTVTAVLCGEGVGDVRVVEPAGAILARVEAEAVAALRAAAGLLAEEP